MAAPAAPVVPRKQPGLDNSFKQPNRTYPIVMMINGNADVIPALGARKLAQLSAEEVDQWLAAKAKTLSTDTLHRLLSILRQSIRRAQARDLVKRNVALLVTFRAGPLGVRRSRSR
jgi:hypothetical protein